MLLSQCLLTSPYVIMSQRFITCNYVVEKHLGFFLQVAMCAACCLAVGVCDTPWAHIFQYFRFFLLCYSKQYHMPYSLGTQYQIMSLFNLVE